MNSSEHDIHPLLRGIVGSTAYGLATPESDVDRLGIHAVTTNRLFTLSVRPVDTVVTHKPDSASHEIHKACSLMFGGNPTVLEVLWLDDYEVCNDIGAQLVEIRQDFLCAQRVRDAYLGYANQQLDRLIHRGRYGTVPDNRIEKHTRHLLRLLEQGYHTWKSGRIKIRVEDPDTLRTTAHQIVTDGERGTERAQAIFSAYEDLFNWTRTPLPATPRFDRAEALIQTTRKTYWND